MILAAGYGTRLGELTARRPKPMMPLCGAPLVRWTALWLRSQGLRELVINLHHLGEQIEDELGDGRALGLAIAYTRESEAIAGTGGGLRDARALLDAGDGRPIVAVNGKIMLDLELAPVVALHERRGAEATMVLRPDPDAARWGALEVDEDGGLIGFLGARHPGRAPAQPQMFTGVHVLQPAFLDRVPPTGEQCIVRTAYAAAFAADGADGGARLAGHVHHGYWWEHSTPERYLQGMRNVLDGRAALAHAELDPRGLTPRGVDPRAEVDAGAVIREPVHIGPGARVEAGAEVGPYAQIDGGAVVRGGARVRDAIVWSGAVVDGDVIGRIEPGDAAG